MKKAQSTAAKTSTRKLSQQQPQLKSKPTSNKQLNLKQFKMEIDHEIAKCLDTLDRQGLKYLRETLKNSDIFNEEVKNTGNTDKNKAKSQVKGKNADQIQQQIIIQASPEKNKPLGQEKSKLGPNTSQPLKQQKPAPIKLQKFQTKIQQPLKPFTKKPSSRQESRQQLRMQSQKLDQSEKQQRKATTKVQEKPKQKIQSTSTIQDKQVKEKSQIDIIVQKINNLPEEKIKQLKNIIEQLEKNQKIQTDSLRNTKPYILKDDPKQSLPNQSHVRSSQNKNKKVEKATSLHNSIIKNKNVENQSKVKYQESAKEIKDQANEIDEQIPEFEEEAQEPKVMDIPDQMKKPIKEFSNEQVKYYSEKVPQNPIEQTLTKKSGTQSQKKASFMKNLPIASIKKPLDIQITQSHQAQTFQLSQSKMVRLGKKKLGTNKVKVVLLRNRGHPSIIGLTCIQFFNMNGKVIPISMQNIKSPNTPKIMKLFNGTFHTINEEQMFSTVFKRDFEIELQIPEKIGGMKVWNYNKSQIESSKETDWIQFYINDKLAWEGLILKGSYNEINDYCTEAEIEDGFSFEKFRKQQAHLKAKVIQQEKQSQGSSQKIRIETPLVSEPFLNKEKGRQKDKKVDWLQNTLIQQKMKEFEEQNKKIQENEPNLPKRLSGKGSVSRFSQIFEQQQKKHTVKGTLKQSETATFRHRRQQFNQYNKQINNDWKEKKQAPGISDIPIQNYQSKQKTNVCNERITRTNSQKMGEQKDIFSSLGQNFIKEKMVSNQINAKVNEILQKTDKFKENFLKDAGFGYQSILNKQEKPQAPPQKIEKQKQKQRVQAIVKKSYKQQSLDDFMNDSLFQEPKKISEKSKPTRQSAAVPQAKIQKKYQTQKPTTTNNKVDIDDFLSELNDLVGTKQNRYRFGNEKQKQMIIPQVPKGNKMQVYLMSNWGDAQTIGLNKIQFFDSQGQKVYPSEAKSNVLGPSVISLFSHNNGFINDHTNQWKCPKRDDIKLQLTFSRKVQFAFIRFWNYIGDRVHSMCGIKKIQILLDGCLIFVGDIRKNGGTSVDQIFKSCEPILFTNNSLIQKKIVENDWFSQQLQGWKQQTVLFKKTIENFMRPLTNGLENRKNIKINENKEGIKLPKRNCFEYDPPTLPTGYFLKLTLHTTWGDRDFIGLNGIVIYDEKCNQIIGIKKISQFPAPLISFPGYEKDKRILNNLFDGKNLTSNDQSIWLAPFLRDVDKMQKQAQNAILIEFDKPYTISAVNIYNYVKTPQRGVREIELHIDQYLVYRGYLRMANPQSGQIMTTVNFTKEQSILQKVNYSGYHQDSLGQQVNFYNEGKVQKPMF